MRSDIVLDTLRNQLKKDEIIDAEIISQQVPRHIFPENTSFREKVTGILAIFALSGLLGLSTVDQNARTAFVGLSVTLVAGYTGVQVMKSQN